MSASPEYATVQKIVSYDANEKGNVNLSGSEFKKELILKSDVHNGICNDIERMNGVVESTMLNNCPDNENNKASLNNINGSSTEEKEMKLDDDKDTNSDDLEIDEDELLDDDNLNDCEDSNISEEVLLKSDDGMSNDDGMRNESEECHVEKNKDDDVVQNNVTNIETETEINKTINSMETPVDEKIALASSDGDDDTKLNVDEDVIEKCNVNKKDNLSEQNIDEKMNVDEKPNLDNDEKNHLSSEKLVKVSEKEQKATEKESCQDEKSNKKAECSMEVDSKESNITDKLDLIDGGNNENIPPMDLNDSQCLLPEIIDESKHKRVNDQTSKVEKLREELRCEEATLALLRKLIDSQRGKNGYKSSLKQGNLPSLHPKQPQNIAPKGSIPIKQQPAMQQGKTLQPTGSQPPLQKYYIQVGNQLVPAPPPGPGGGTIYQYANGNSANSYSAYQQPVAKPAPPKQTPEQKQTAAKAALRRQLEQTLLQIPPPLPPSADWKAIPNVNSMDFMMLVGLDEVVDSILDMDSKPTLKNALEALMPYNPRICSQCKVDFSPCWKNKDGNSKAFVLCERCALQNIKKDLKAEHTSRLKSAFLKALKQEQEIEEKIKAGEDVNIGNITGIDKNDVLSPSLSQHQGSRISSPQPQVSVAAQPPSSHASSPSERHQSSSNHHHSRHQVVQHYPHHTSLVQQLHHQHIQQQQLEMEPSSQRHSSNRWHPYLPPSPGHHRDHHPVHHRSYAPASSTAPVGGSGGSDSGNHQEYYVVHHPHSNVRYINR